MAKQKAKTVDKSITEEELDAIVLPEEAEKQHLKELKEAEKAEKAAKKAAKEEAKEEIAEKIEAKAEENDAEAGTPSRRASKSRSRNYVAIRRLVERSKNYTLKQAVELIQKTSYTKFVGTIVADLVTKDDKVNVDVKFPHSTGKTVRVAIATDALLADIEAGKIDFDILVTEPKMMPKLAKYARVLGPKGLMPNPKNGTIAPDPEKRAKELSGGKTTVKTEKKMPLMHVTIGKTDLKAVDLVDNTKALIKAVGPKKIVKLVLSATMSPGIKVDLTPYQTA
jgi:large subunit ribosomal protein L1